MWDGWMVAVQVAGRWRLAFCETAEEADAMFAEAKAQRLTSQAWRL